MNLAPPTSTDMQDNSLRLSAIQTALDIGYKIIVVMAFLTLRKHVLRILTPHCCRGCQHQWLIAPKLNFLKLVLHVVHILSELAWAHLSSTYSKRQCEGFEHLWLWWPPVVVSKNTLRQSARHTDGWKLCRLYVTVVLCSQQSKTQRVLKKNQSQKCEANLYKWDLLQLCQPTAYEKYSFPFFH